MAKLLAKIAPETYQEYVSQRHGQAYIYCHVNVAIDGNHPCDWCVANKDIDGSQCTIVWHVNDLKISHKDSDVVDKVIASLKEEYGQVGEITVCRGNKHNYLSMMPDFSKDGTSVVDVEDYLKDI